MDKITFFFEQDGAPSHTSKKTMNWIEKQNVQIIENWPANSPDLTCIEQVWSILEQKIQKYQIKTLDDLYISLQKEWYAIPQQKLDNLISQTPNRFDLCLKEKGLPIGHKLYKLKNTKTDSNNNSLNNSCLLNSFNDDQSTINSDFTKILHLPLNHEKNFELCLLIATNLLDFNELPYLLKEKRENNLLTSYKNVIKHHISVPLLIEKLVNNEYQDVDCFKNDVDLMLNNMEIIYGKNSETWRIIEILEKEISNAFRTSI